MKRRDFLRRTGWVTGAAACSTLAGNARAETVKEPAASTTGTTPKTESWLWPTLKIGMIREGETLTEKFQIAKRAGFLGVELSAPSVDAEEANQAAEATGMIIDGTVGKYHWKIRHTDPDPAVREQALGMLRSGIRNTAAVGADTMLLVPGHGKDGTPAEVMDRAVAAVRAALPQAEESGVTIVIVNVWNHFLYDHDGGSDQTADALADFVDGFDSPFVGVQYDIGNHWKYGDPAAWIRTLGKRITKLDVKGFSRVSGKFTPITEGDLPWASVKTALREINYRGWLAAEVSGGDELALKKVRDQMEAALGCNEVVA